MSDGVGWFQMSGPDMLLARAKKQLRSVLLSEKGGVAADRLERDFRNLVRQPGVEKPWFLILFCTGWGDYSVTEAGIFEPGSVPEEHPRRVQHPVAGAGPGGGGRGEQGHGAHRGEYIASMRHNHALRNKEFSSPK